MWQYKTSVEWKGGERANLHCHEKPTVAITAPPEFGGERDHWSPEDLLVGAIESCMLLTLLFFVDKMKIDMRSYRSEAVGDLDRTSNGLRFQNMAMEVHAEVGTAEDVEKFSQAAENAEKFCPVSSAVNFPVSLKVQATPAD